jgi:hypothetical protein
MVSMWSLLLLTLLLAPPLAAQPQTVLPNPMEADSAAQDAGNDAAEIKQDRLPQHPGFHDIAKQFDQEAQRRIGRALAELPRATDAPRISVVILDEPDGEIQDHAARIFQSCCADADTTRAGQATMRPGAGTTDAGSLLLVVYTAVQTVGIAGDDRAFATIPRATVEQIMDDTMMADGFPPSTNEQVHAGLTTIFEELGADARMIQRVSANGPSTPRGESVEDVLLVLALFFAVLFIPGVVVTGVVTVMESSGCLRYLLLFLSWGLISAWTGSTSVGLHELLGRPLGGDFTALILILGGGVVGFVVYAIIMGIMNRWLDDLSTEDRETWKYTLQGGAAVGAGAGAVGNLIRTAAAKGSSGFGGFGGGGFGGGGAGGSFQAASGAAGAASGSGAASGAAAAGSSAASGAAASGAVSTASVSGGAVGSAGVLSGLSAKYRWRALRRQLRAFRWYHYLTFAVVAYVFYQIAIYALWALEFEPLFWLVAVPVSIYAAIQLWDRWGPDLQERVSDRFGQSDGNDEDDPDFPGDHAMARW